MDIKLTKALTAKGDKLFGAKTWDVDIETRCADYKSYRLTLQSYPDGLDTLYADEVADITVGQLPGCCGVAVLSDLYVEIKNKGYGEFLTQIALQYAVNQGYTLAMATTLARNKNTTKIGMSVTATPVESFKNRRTGNIVEVWTKKLPKAIKYS